MKVDIYVYRPVLFNFSFVVIKAITFHIVRTITQKMALTVPEEKQ